MRWSGDPIELERWCVATRDLNALRAALDTVPAHLRAAFYARLIRALAAPAAEEPGPGDLRRDTLLASRMTSPAAILLRQLRLEKLRLIEALQEA